MLIIIKRIFNFFSLIIVIFLGFTNISWGIEETYFRLLKIIDKSTNAESDNVKAFIKVSISGKSNKYHALGWVDIAFGVCGYAIADGDLKLTKNGNNTGELISVKNFPLEGIGFKNTSLENNPALVRAKVYDTPEEPFFWIDIDGDGEDELIYSSVFGNRGSTHYTIFEYNEFASTKKLSNPIEIRDLILSQIPQLELTSYSSGGVCANSKKTFSSINGKYVLTKFSSQFFQNDCFNQEFELVNDRWCLKKSYQIELRGGDSIEKNTKFYSDEKCYLKDDFLSKYRADQGYFQ